VKRKWKILIGVLILTALGVGVYASTVLSKKGVVTVQTGTVVRQDLTSLVTASGEIKPRNYINIGANAQGELKEVLVKEGDRVRKGQLLARIESTQPQADVKAQEAAVNSAEADSSASEAGQKASEENIRTLQAAVDKDKSDLERAKAEFNRSESLFKEHLIAKQDFEMRKFAYEAQQATIRQSEMRLVQARAQREQAAAQLASAQTRIAQAKANLLRFNDLLNKRNVVAPLEGVVTNLPVRVGETVVPGVQNSAASTIMTIADMSLITSEIKVDETDIVNVKMGQAADVTIDAIPNKIFKGHVIEIGNTAILRSTGVAASQSAVSSQEAKDFKVVVALDSPPDEIRPGLSCTAKITTATRKNVLTIPIQALTVRQKGQLEPKPKDGKGVEAATTKLDPVAEKAKKEELQGVFVVAGGKAVFKKVETGITGATDIEVLSGLNDGEEIITGTYQVIRTIANEAQVKVDNKAPAATTPKS
jgi:HlyD family secretion protein